MLPLLHVGYHKTGSTWLQQMLFTSDEAGFVLPFERRETNDRLVAPGDLVFDGEAERAYWAPGIERARAVGRIPVVSNERFAGNPHAGGWDARILADRLRAVFGEARVLLILREQKSVIRSMYFQYVREGGPLSLERYLHPPRAGAYRLPLFDFEYYAYHRLIACYHERFSRERVLVLPYELLQSDPEDFVKRLCDFSGATPPSNLSSSRRNVGLSAFSVELKRRLNRWFVRDRLNPGAPFAFERANRLLLRGAGALDRRLPQAWLRPFDRRVRDRIEAEVEDRYRSSNRESSALIGLELRDFGYPV